MPTMEPEPKPPDRLDKPMEIMKTSAKNQIPRLPVSALSERSDRATRAGTFALLGGALASLASQTVTELNQTALRDDITILSAAGAAAFFSTIRASQLELCTTPGERRREGTYNVVKGSGGGLLSGVTVAGFLTHAGVATLPLDGGLVLGLGLLGAGGAFVLNRIRKTKECPHCKHKGKCNQRVCRNCYRIFYPYDELVDCKNEPWLDWYRIASYLQKRGNPLKFSYLDAQELFKDKHQEWRMEYINGEYVADCEKFVTWVEENPRAMADYAGVGKKGKSTEKIEEYLTKEAGV